ncbi:TetR family transcriptional regulator [Pontibacillus yanchengensis]|uniref:TetR family transcriptional regulator n=2 Tax=Pontibacillus yanchengensis TaxID=462910 RepID=A0ACC7VDH8_9BACI|nr:TetR/AcrR family transcriptional regulator [Pontibacillus yanchengensis]MYL32150.1 TetR family transcriptional regulator [Pontibacillus yanchengensis]MYL52730.1 TetR family transcriptional regulator [Pontibacillus yanchengensis]
MSPRAGLNQALIIDKALEIANIEGVEAVTIAILARELNIKSPSLYNHVKSLTEIREAMAIQALTLMEQHLKEATADIENGAARIRALGKAYVRFANYYPGIYEASLSSPDPSSQQVMEAGEGVVTQIKEALSPYPFSEEKMIHAIRGLRSLLHGLVDLHYRGGFNLEVDLKESQEFMVETFIKGL